MGCKSDCCTTRKTASNPGTARDSPRHCRSIMYFVLEQGQHSYSCSLVPGPTSSFDCLQHSQAPGTTAPLPTIAAPLPPTNTCLRTCTGHIYTEPASYLMWNTKYSENINNDLHNVNPSENWGRQSPGNEAKLAKQLIKNWRQGKN